MEKLFKKFGLNDKEIKTFLTLLKLGSQPVSIIAKRVGIPRSSMYIVIDQLKKHKFINVFTRSNIKYVKCIPVNEILDIINIKEQNIQNIKKLYDENINKLKKLEQRMDITPKVYFYEGKEEIKKMYEKIIKEKFFYAFFNPKLVEHIMPEYFYKIPEMLKENNGTAKEILVECEEACEYKAKYNSKHHEVKILNKNTLFLSDTIICENDIYMISYGETEISAVEISNKSLAETQQVVFNAFWNSLK